MTTAYEQGESTAAHGGTVGLNPYSPETETQNYEDWIDGWCHEHEEQRDFDSLFTS